MSHASYRTRISFRARFACTQLLRVAGQHRVGRSRLALSLALTLTVFGLTACGGGGSSSPTPDPQPANPAALATAQPGEVLDYVKRNLAARGPQGVQSTFDWQAA